MTKFHDKQNFAYPFMTQVTEPTIQKDILSSVDSHYWKTAMNQKYQSLIQNST